MLPFFGRFFLSLFLFLQFFDEESTGGVALLSTIAIVALSYDTNIVVGWWWWRKLGSWLYAVVNKPINQPNKLS